jgi:hypothetical protein
MTAVCLQGRLGVPMIRVSILALISTALFLTALKKLSTATDEGVKISSFVGSAVLRFTASICLTFTAAITATYAHKDNMPVVGAITALPIMIIFGYLLSFAVYILLNCFPALQARIEPSRCAVLNIIVNTFCFLCAVGLALLVHFEQ